MSKIRRVNDDLVEEEARQLLIDGQRWSTNGNISTLAITKAMVTQPRSLVAKKMRELVSLYSAEVPLSHVSTDEAVTVTASDEEALKPIRHALRMHLDPEAFKAEKGAAK